MADQFQTHAKPRPASASRHVAITTGTLTDVPDAICCLTAGSLTVTDSVGTAITYPMAAGQVVDLRMSVFTVVSGTFVAWYL
jgi:hypothetical protein